MTSNLGCVGLGVDDVDALAALLDEVIPTGTATRQEDGSALYVWTDPSGARLTVTTDRAGDVDTVSPSYDGQPGVVLGGLVGLHDAVVAADVLEAGEVVTRLAVEVLPPLPVPACGGAVLTAFGVDVSLHPSAEEFAAADASLVTPGSAAEEEPLRMGSESFLSYGVFADAAVARPIARLNGQVVGTRTATVDVTGQAFHAVRVRTVGMEVDVCLAAADHPTAPEPGAVVAGTVYLVADIERPRARRRWFGSDR
jgi:hypothetical protein